LKAAAQNRNVDTTKAQVLVQVEQAYYQALGAQAVLRAAQAALENRRLTLRQVRALAESSFKSTLDVSFAEVVVSEAELQLYRSENDVQAGQARLAAALGYESAPVFELVDESMPPLLDATADELIARALKDRPDLASLALNRDAATRFADAEKRLKYPSVSMIAAAGEIPQHLAAYRGNYGAAGLNVNIPILNGGLYAARRAEADLRARAATDDVQDLTIQIARDVRLAWLEANTAYRRLDVMARLVSESDQALRLAQVRYDNGLGSIVELNQAQLNQTAAQIAAASAKYEYLSRRAALDYAVGAF
jgi:outer membrane protein